MNATALKKWISDGNLDKKFLSLYGKNQLEMQKERYIEAVDAFVELYGDKDNLALFSAPGRTEIAGNHTDHNHGRVVAASQSGRGKQSDLFNTGNGFTICAEGAEGRRIGSIYDFQCSERFRIIIVCRL